MSPCSNGLIDHPVGVHGPQPTPHELWQRYHRQGDSPSENALVEQYLPLVRSILARLAIGLPEHADHDDLHSAGLLGLLQALRNYDPASGTSFEAYARLRVRGAMLDELRRMDWVPRAIHEKARRIQAVMTELEQRLGRVATDAEVAQALDLSPQEYSEVLDEIRPATFLCLDAVSAADGGEGACNGDFVADPAEDSPVDHACRHELKRLIFQRLKTLPSTQRKVVALYYGEDLHLREIAEVLGVTESRVCQIHSQAILSIRAYLHRVGELQEAASNRGGK